MTTIVEKDSSTPAVLLIFVSIILLIGGGGLGFGYINGTFGGKTTVIENNKTVVMPAPVIAPVSAKP